MLIQDIYNYLRKPEYLHAREMGVLQKLRTVFRVWTLIFAISLLGIPISYLISNAYGTTFADHAAFEYAAKRTFIQVIWGAVIFFPIWEELVFRIGLRYRRLNLSLGLSFFAVYISRLIVIVLKIPRPTWLFSPDTPIGVLSILIPAVVLTLLLWMTLSRIGDDRLESFYRRRYRIIFYIPLLVFALLHALNFERDIWIFAPLLVIPQLALAAGFGYVRMKFGFPWTVAMHIFNNAFTFLPALILEELSPAIMKRFIGGDFTAISQLPPRESAIIFAFNMVWSVFFVLIFLSFASMIWEWVKNRKGVRKHAVISSTMNCLLPGLGQFYNNQVQKGKILTSIFVAFSLIAAVPLSLPANYSSVERLLNVGLALLTGYIAIYIYAITDAWIVGRRLDKAETIKIGIDQTT